MSERPDCHPLDDCPDCGEPMALVLAVLGGPDAQGGGAFRFCTDCGELYARAGNDRRWLDRRGYRMLAREALRLRALVPPVRRDERYAARPVAEDGDPALPRTIGEAAARNQRRWESEGEGASGPYGATGGVGVGRHPCGFWMFTKAATWVGIASHSGAAWPGLSGTTADSSSTPERTAAMRRGMAVREKARRSIMRPSRQQGSCQPRRPHVALTLRLPPELHARVQAALERERRTLTQQVIYLLEQWVEEQERERQERGGAGEC